MSKEILQSSLLEPGACFTVTETVKDSVYSPGSLGFISFIRGTDEAYQNLAKVLTTMVRRGKGGKPRIENANLYLPIFEVDHAGFQKLMPTGGQRKYYVHIERALPLTNDLMELKALNFLGYATSLAKKIKHMSDQCKHRKWPESKSNPLNIFKRLPDYFAEDPEVYMEKYALGNFRENFILEARRMHSTMIRVHLQLDVMRAKTELNAAEFMLFTNKGEFIPKDTKDKDNEYVFTEDNAMLERTIAFYEKLLKGIETLYENKKKTT